MIKQTIILVPHYKGSFETFLHLALYVKNNNVGTPHFVLYFEDNTEAKRALKDHKIDFSVFRNGLPTKVPLIGRVVKLITDLIYSVKLANRLAPVQAMVCAIETQKLEYALISVLNRRKINTIVLQWAQTVPKEYYQSIREKEGSKNAISAVKALLKNYIGRFIEKIFRIKRAKSYGSGDAKYFAVMGNYYRDMFIAQGVSKDKLVVTGHPEFDLLYELSRDIKNPEFKKAILESFGLDNTKPIWIVAREAIVYFKLVPEEKDEQDISTVLEILSEYHPEVKIILKLHPRDSEGYYEFVKEKFPHIIIIHECDLYRLIAVCELYISQISNTMMWAVALDKPVISYDFNNQPYWHYFRDKEGLIKANSPQELTKEVKAIRDKGLSPEKYQKYKITKQRYMTLDGKACERIAALIVKEH